MQTIRIQTKTGGWTAPMPIELKELDGGLATIRVIPLRQTWIVGDTGMIANIGGNCPFVYDLHPDDCKAICNLEPSKQTTP